MIAEMRSKRQYDKVWPLQSDLVQRIYTKGISIKYVNLLTIKYPGHLFKIP